MNLHLKILLMFSCITMMNFAMQGDMKRRALPGSGPKSMIMQIDCNDKCMMCFEPLSVRKCALATTYCEHSYHKMCYDRMLKKNPNQKCYCQQPLQVYDATAIEEIIANKKVKEKSKSCIEESVYCCADLQVECFRELFRIFVLIHKENSSAWLYPG